MAWPRRTVASMMSRAAKFGRSSRAARTASALPHRSCASWQAAIWNVASRASGLVGAAVTMAWYSPMAASYRPDHSCAKAVL